MSSHYIHCAIMQQRHSVVKLKKHIWFELWRFSYAAATYYIIDSLRIILHSVSISCAKLLVQVALGTKVNKNLRLLPSLCCHLLLWVVTLLTLVFMYGGSVQLFLNIPVYTHATFGSLFHADENCKLNTPFKDCYFNPYELKCSVCVSSHWAVI